MQEVLFIAFGASFGANLRALLVHLSKDISQYLSFPIGILIANCLGCLLAGAYLHLSGSKSLPAYMGPMISIGFFGALTTFSTFAIDSVKLFRVSFSSGMINILANLSLCLILVLAGESLCKKVFS
ncbi:MAG: CrcB family protein [Candidatus Cloacimonetes bacterium]|nr:CrcB family protein [Candidatus Cloacimonadota bacterium]